MYKRQAISSPLLETSIAGAHGVIINITSIPDIGLEDVETAAGLITQSAHPDANIIWGTAFDENLSDAVSYTHLLLRRHQPDDAFGRDGHRAFRLPGRKLIKTGISCRGRAGAARKCEKKDVYKRQALQSRRRTAPPQ